MFKIGDKVCIKHNNVKIITYRNDLHIFIMSTDLQYPISKRYDLPIWGDQSFYIPCEFLGVPESYGYVIPDLRTKYPYYGRLYESTHHITFILDRASDEKIAYHMKEDPAFEENGIYYLQRAGGWNGGPIQKVGEWGRLNDQEAAKWVGYIMSGKEISGQILSIYSCETDYETHDRGSRTERKKTNLRYHKVVTSTELAENTNETYFCILQDQVWFREVEIQLKFLKLNINTK